MHFSFHGIAIKHFDIVFMIVTSLSIHWIRSSSPARISIGCLDLFFKVMLEFEISKWTSEQYFWMENQLNSIKNINY